MGVSGEHNVPACLPPGKTPYAMYRRLVGLEGQYGRAREILQPPPPPGRGQSILYWVVLPTTLLWPIKTRIYTCWCVCVCTSTDGTLRQQNKEEIVTGLSIAAIQQLWQEPVKCIAKEGITKDNIDHKQINRILKQNHTTSKPHLTKQCKTRQLQRLYSRKQPRCRRRSVRCKPQQRNLWRSTNVINNKNISFYN